jgi:hypothetical protein
MRDQQDGRQAIERISKSRESCHPVKNPNRSFSDLCGDETIKRYWLSACAKRSQCRIRRQFMTLRGLTAHATLSFAKGSLAGVVNDPTHGSGSYER